MNPQARQKFISSALQNGYSAADINAYLGNQEKTNETAQSDAALQVLAKTGNVDGDTFNKLVASNPTLAVKLIAQGYSPKATPTAKQQETSGKKSDVLREVDVLEGYLNSAEGRGPIAGRAAIFPAGVTRGAVNPNVYQFQEKRNTLIGNLARLISGEVGVLTDQDIQRAESLLPRIDEPEDIAKQKLAALRNSLGELMDTKGANAPTKKQRGIIESLISPLTDTLKTIGGAAVEGGRALNPASRSGQRTANENPFLSDAELEKYSTDPLGQLLNQTGRSAALISPAIAKATAVPGFLGALKGGAIIGGAGGASNPREGLDLTGRLGDVAGGAATGAALGGATYGVLQVAANAGKIIHPFRTVGEMKRAAVAASQGSTIDGSQLMDALNKKLPTVSPTQRTAFMRFIEVAKPIYEGKTLPIDQATALLTEADRSAYLASGKVGKAATAAFNESLATALREQILDVAPSVSEANKAFSTLYGVQKAVKGAKSAAMTAGLFKLLGVVGL